jgi:hypothetical protein
VITRARHARPVRAVRSSRSVKDCAIGVPVRWVGFELVPPVVVFMPLWHPDSPVDVDDHHPERSAVMPE